MSVTSEPTGARFVIKGSSGLQYSTGNTPQMVSIPRKNEYQVEFAAAGYRPQTVVLTKGINGWVWGNLVFGWLIGFGVDFIGGAAYKLEPAQVSITLSRGQDEFGASQLWGVVRELSKEGRLIKEHRVLLEPAR